MPDTTTVRHHPWRASLVFTLTLTFLIGAAYPFAVWGVSRLLFPAQAEGNLVRVNGKVVGSSLIGQSFDDPGYFWGRLSATSPNPYNAANSSGSNLGPTNPALLEAAKARIAALRQADPSNTAPVPLDLVTASGSGLDPHISPEAAEFQARRVARVRGVPTSVVEGLLRRRTEGRTFGFMGERRVNVLLLNLDLDAFAPGQAVK